MGGLLTLRIAVKKKGNMGRSENLLYCIQSPTYGVLPIIAGNLSLINLPFSDSPPASTYIQDL